MIKWIFYTSVVGFAVYWVSNLLLWYPWSYSTYLGMTLMLTVSPLLWAYSVFLCLKAYPKNNLLSAATIIAVILLMLSVIMDYLFFGIIRKAIEELYHPTTFYGYGFVMVLPFLISIIFKKRISQSKRDLTNIAFVKPALVGVACLFTLTLIILLDLNL